MNFVELAKTTTTTVLRSQITKKVVAAIAGAIVTGVTGNAYERFVIGADVVGEN